MEKSPPNRCPQLNRIFNPNFLKLHPQNVHTPTKMETAPKKMETTPKSWDHAPN
jgi:hypothetical protein